MWEKNKKKKKKTHNFKIPRAHIYPQTTSKMLVKFRKHLLKASCGRSCAHKVPTTICIFILLKHENSLC